MRLETTAAESQRWIRDAVDRFEGPLTLYAARLIRNDETARDVVQDTFLRLCGKRRDEVDGHLAEWLFTVCRNRALDVLRKEGRMSHLMDEHAESQPSPESDPSELTERREAADRALACLESLPANQREVIRLKFQNGFSYREISRISGHSVSNVGFLIHTGLKTIRQRLGVEIRAAGA